MRIQELPKCDLCETGPYSRTGLKLHRGTGRCLRLKAEKPLREQVQRRKEELMERGKRTMTRVVTNALERRGASDLCGLEKAETGWILGNNHTDSEAVEEVWVWHWVKAYYQQTPSSEEFYTTVERLVRKSMDPGAPGLEDEINLIKLAVTVL